MPTTLEHKKLPQLPQTVEAILGDMIEGLRRGIARTRMATEMMNMVRGLSAERFGNSAERAELIDGLARVEAELGDTERHIAAVEETVKLLETLRVERLIEAANRPMRQFTEQRRGVEPIITPPPKHEG